MKVLAGDIGGTQIRLAIFDVRGQAIHPESEQSCLSKDYSTFELAVQEFVANAKAEVDAVCFGVAGPVLNGRCIATNLPWTIDATQLKSVLSLSTVNLINDLAANSLGVRALTEKDFYTVNAGSRNPSGNACIIAAGTGLGEAGMYWDGEQHQPFASEGGHCDFAAETKLDYCLHQYLADRHGHVSWERVVSGMGIVNLFEFLYDQNKQPVPDWFIQEKQSGDAASAISKAALVGNDQICTQTMDLFLHYYGAEAGNLALKTMASGGIYIGGGIAPKIIDLFKQKTFLDSLCAKGRMEPLLREMPVKVILNDRTALLGAAIQASVLC